jgi:hypothetical protein
MFDRVATERRIECLYMAVLATICAALFFFNLGRIPFFDKGEPREALVVRDIVLNGNWLFPLKLDQQIPSKPPLFHWSAAIASLTWGQMTEATVRFPSALFATFGVFLLYFMGRRLYGPQTGLFAGLILATSMVYQDAAVEARVDMTLTFFLTSALVIFYGFYQGFLNGEGWKYLFFLTLGLGVLAKGPVSLVLSGLIIALFLALKKRWDLFWRLSYHPGLILGVTVFSLWYGLALWKGGEQFLGLQFIKENLARFFVHGEGGTGHQKPFYYFVSYLFTLALPWTIFLPCAVLGFFKDEYFHDDHVLFLGLWAGSVFVFFSLSAGKRPVYILPLYPPLALLLAIWFQRCKVATAHLRGMQIITWLAAAVGALTLIPLVTFLTGGDPFAIVRHIEARLKPNDLRQFQIVLQSLQGIGWLFPLFLLVSSVLWFLTAYSLAKRRIVPVVVQVAWLCVMAGLLVQGVAIPAIADAQSYKAFVQTVNHDYRADGTLYLFPKGLDYNSIVFYAADDLQVLSEEYGMLLDKLKRSKGHVIMGEKQWRELAVDDSAAFPVELRSHGTGPDADDALVLIRAAR